MSKAHSRLKSPDELRLSPNAKIGVVTGRFNESITAELRKGALAELRRLGAADSRITAVWVPGAFEIPLAAKWLLTADRCDGVIALGAVIRGETPHFDYVCSAVERGCTLLQLESAKPVVFGVLTTDNEAQARDRIGGAHGHKGVEAAQTLTEMLLLRKCLEPKKSKQKK
jgi:6,7-dimethyl-8-ribityllumazine synthase